MEEMTATLPHLSFSDQFMGFAGSSGPSQSTMFGSDPACCVSSSFLLDDELGVPASRSVSTVSFSRSELAFGGASDIEDMLPASGVVEESFSGCDDDGTAVEAITSGGAEDDVLVCCVFGAADCFVVVGKSLEPVEVGISEDESNPDTASPLAEGAH